MTGEVPCPRPECPAEGEATVAFEADYERETFDCPGGWSVVVEPKCSAGCCLDGKAFARAEEAALEKAQGARADRLDETPRSRRHLIR